MEKTGFYIELADGHRVEAHTTPRGTAELLVDDAPIAECLHILILATLFQTENLLNICQFLILVELHETDIFYVEQLTTKREDAPELASHHFEACNGARRG